MPKTAAEIARGLSEPDMQGFALRVSQLRQECRMSLDDLSGASGMTKSHCWEIEKGRSKNPTIRSVWGLAKALGTTPSYLLGINPNEPPIDPLATRVAAIISAELEARASATIAQTESANDLPI